MRLLEFGQTDSDTDPQETAHIAARANGLPGAHPAPPARPARQAAGTAIPGTRVFPVKSGTVHMPAQRGPIDLENLQQRVALLEKRIKMRVQTNQASTPNLELEQLKQRLLKLERNINSELWAAKQREYTLLEMLARPPLSARIGRRIAHFRKHNLPAIGRWFIEASREWLQDRQPDWWPRFTRAWQESLDSARDSFNVR